MKHFSGVQLLQEQQCVFDAITKYVSFSEWKRFSIKLSSYSQQPFEIDGINNADFCQETMVKVCCFYKLCILKVVFMSIEICIYTSINIPQQT